MDPSSDLQHTLMMKSVPAAQLAMVTLWCASFHGNAKAKRKKVCFFLCSVSRHLYWLSIWTLRDFSYQVVESMRRGMEPKLAAKDAISRIARKFPDFVGAVFAVNRNGAHAGACYGWTFQYSVRTPDMDEVKVFTVHPDSVLWWMISRNAASYLTIIFYHVSTLIPDLLHSCSLKKRKCNSPLSIAWRSEEKMFSLVDMDGINWIHFIW